MTSEEKKELLIKCNVQDAAEIGTGKVYSSKAISESATC